MDDERNFPPMKGEAIRNYFQNSAETIDGIRYRLDGTDLIEAAIDTLRGGVKEKVSGRKIYYEDRRLLNELGISRAKILLMTGVNKDNHLTKYANEERIMRQIKSLMRAWTIEFVRNAKRWAPRAEFGPDGMLTNSYGWKAENMRLVNQILENPIYQSMQRGTAGFEAELLSKTMFVTENLNRDQNPQGRGGFFGKFFNPGKESRQEYG